MPPSQSESGVTMGRRVKRLHERLLIRVSLSAWVVYLLVVTCGLGKVCSFLHPIRLLHLNKQQISTDPKVPLLNKNGDNYRVFFRPEFDPMDEKASTTVRGAGEISATRRTGGRRDLVSNKKKRRERDRSFQAKKRSKGSKAKTGMSPFRLLKAESSSPTLTQSSTDEDTGAPPFCRIVTLSDGKIPTSQESLPEELFEEPHVLRKLDGLYHAMSHEETRRLQYMETKSDPFKPHEFDEEEEHKLLSTVRTSIEDAGFQLLTRRDLDLCDALNAAYLLRLSIVPDVKNLDEDITKEFYPEFYNENGDPKLEDLLFDGKVLVFWRGYSQEVSQGRLILPKLDYLQASVVQRSAAWLERKLGSAEKKVRAQLSGGIRRVTQATFEGAQAVVEHVPHKNLSRALRTSLKASAREDAEPSDEEATVEDRSSSSFFKLSRYGGSKFSFVGSPNPADALDPFVVCQVDGESGDLSNFDDDMYQSLNQNELRCLYDLNTEGPDNQLPPMQMLERVTISNLVDIFSKEGRKSFVKSMRSKSELVEPTYEEVVVIWRQKDQDEGKLRKKKRRWLWPRVVYDLADMFDFDGLVPLPTEEPMQKKRKMPLQIRTFDGVPMANLPAVMPKTKLVFRPADAAFFDLISVASFCLAAGSFRFTSPKLDILAFLSMSVWAIRMFLRYSNKMARYDLLAKTFLTSKISHRNSGALKYLLAQAGEQRAARAALVHAWLSRQPERVLDRSAVLNQGMMEVNDIVKGKQVHVDIAAALGDLEDIGFVTCDGNKVEVMRDSASIGDRIRRAWNAVLEGQLTLAALVGRRDRERAI